MERQYMIRLDDACPTMDRAKWQCMEDMRDAVGVKLMVGVIPRLGACGRERSVEPGAELGVFHETKNKRNKIE